ncbi:MAG: hypothetical protein WCK32_00510 [Chlorobiaceae bacterium]
MTLDWPNLIAGGIVGALIAPLPAILVRLGYMMIGKGASSFITGEWFSAEYDLKSTDTTKRNTILKVRVKRRLDGKVVVEALDGLVYANPKRPTQWKVLGVVRNEVLVGTWRSTTPHSTRHGSVLLKFYDDGRAFGYYLGVSDVPVCGYWLMSREEADLRELAEAVEKEFPWADLKTLVDKNDPRVR